MDVALEILGKQRQVYAWDNIYTLTTFLHKYTFKIACIVICWEPEYLYRPKAFNLNGLSGHSSDCTGAACLFYLINHLSKLALFKRQSWDSCVWPMATLAKFLLATGLA